MAGSNGTVSQVTKSASTPPVYTATIAYPAVPGPPPVAAHDDIYVLDATDFLALNAHVTDGAKIDAPTGVNGGAIGSYTVHK